MSRQVGRSDLKDIIHLFLSAVVIPAFAKPTSSCGTLFGSRSFSHETNIAQLLRFLTHTATLSLPLFQFIFIPPSNDYYYTFMYAYMRVPRAIPISPFFF